MTPADRDKEKQRLLTKMWELDAKYKGVYGRLKLEPQDLLEYTRECVRFPMTETEYFADFFNNWDDHIQPWNTQYQARYISAKIAAVQKGQYPCDNPSELIAKLNDELAVLQ